jgi:hypothetical protein
MNLHTPKWTPTLRVGVPMDSCRNLTLRECEDETHTPEMRTWESPETLESLEFDYKGQNTLHCGVFYTIGNLSKCRCRKWPCLSHFRHL